MKTITLSTLIVGMYNSPTYALLIAIVLVFIIDLINRLSYKRTALNSNYEAIKEIFNCAESHNYLEDKNLIGSDQIDYIEITCASLDFSDWSYQDINTMARLHKLRPSNRKKQTLIQSLQEV